MKVSRKLLLLSLLVTSLVVMSIAMVAPSAAQSGRCTTIGVATSGDFLVDVDENRNDGLVESQVQCKVLISPEAGTPLSGNRAIPDYTSVGGIDVWTSNARADFDIYDPAVRVCFRAAAFGVSTTDAIGPAEMEAGQSGPALMYSDARHINTLTRSSDSYSGGSRNFNALDVVTTDTYICGDISYPGSINLVPSVPGFASTDPAHPLFEDQPDRCLVPGASDCID